MRFQSGTLARDGRTVNHDPEPHRDPGGYSHVRYAEPQHGAGDGSVFTEYRPRPKFAVLDNPILAAVREAPSVSAQSWLDSKLLRDELPMSNYTPEQIDHSRRVLSKLVAVYG